jgi:hypothetical protein
MQLVGYQVWWKYGRPDNPQLNPFTETRFQELELNSKKNYSSAQ